MTQEDWAYFINSYLVKVALFVLMVCCPQVILAAFGGLCLLGAFLIEQITYEAQSISSYLEHADKVFVVLSGIFIAIGYMI